MNQVQRINYRIEYRVFFELVRFIVSPTYDSYSTIMRALVYNNIFNSLKKIFKYVEI